MKEGGKFGQAPQPKFPRLIVTGYASIEHRAQWDFTPPPDDQMYQVKFTCKQDLEGNLYVFMEPETFMPIG